jgi:GDP-L-fucose synthase
MAQSYAKQYGMQVVLPMPTNAYGVNDNFDPQGGQVIPALMNRMIEARKTGASELQMWGSGTPMREFIYVDDLADAFIFLMENWESAELVNVGTGWEISIAELAQKIADVVGYTGTLTNDTSKPDGVMRKCLNSSKLQALGWQPQVQLDEGLRRMYEHHFGSSVAAA